MSEFETFEALYMTMEMGVLASMNFLAILFAYVAATFVAGEKLPRSVAVSLSVVYTVILIPHFLGCIGNIARTFNAGHHLGMMYPDSWAATGSNVPMEALLLLFAVPMLVGWVGSLLYMHAYVRRPDTSALNE